MPLLFLLYYPFLPTSWPSFCFICITVTSVQLNPCVSSVHLGPVFSKDYFFQCSIAQHEPGHGHRGDLRLRRSDPRGSQAYRGPGLPTPHPSGSHGKELALARPP